MKKNQTILKTVFLFLFAVFLIQGCREEQIANENTANTAHKSKTIATLKEVLDATSLKNSKDVMARSASISSVYNPNEYEMDTLTIRKTFHNSEITEYAIALKKKNETQKGVFYNIVFTRKNNKWEKFLIKLTPEYYYKDTELVIRHRIQIISSETSKKNMKSASCNAEYYSIEYFSCDWGHTNPYDGDCGGCWKTFSSGFTYNCDQESINRDFGIGGDSMGSGGATSPMLTMTSPNAINYLLTQIGMASLNTQQYNFLVSHPKIADYFKNYFWGANQNIDGANFLYWGINFFIQNPNTSIEQFQNWFMGESEGQDGTYDATYWDNPNLTFQKQNLPTWNAYYNAYPHHADGTGMTADEVYTLVGGIMKQNHFSTNIIIAKQWENACAIRVSRALNYSGITIPAVPGTFKGDDGKNYFVSAKAINAWMRKTFGVAPSNLNHIHITSQMAGTNGVNLPNLLLDKNLSTSSSNVYIKGIYSLISSNSNWASGHADCLQDNGKCVNYCHFDDAPIDYIDIWILK